MPKTDFLPLAQDLFLFTDQDNRPFAQLPSNTTSGTFARPLRSPDFRDWFFQQCGQTGPFPSSRDFNHILHLLEARSTAEPSNRRISVFRRVGNCGASLFADKLFIDLANPYSQFVEISPRGWRVEVNDNVHFESSPSADPLPPPDTRLPDAADQPHPLEALRSLLNLASRADWLRFLAFLLACFRPEYPFPVLVIRGPRSSGKTMAARILRALVDPSAAAFAPADTSVRQLPNLIRHNWLLAFDHISSLTPKFSAALCRLATGMGVALREPGTPSSEPVIKEYRRPVVLTVDERFSCPADLAEHTFTVNCAPLPPAARASALALNQGLRQVRAQIFAAICQALSTVLRRLPAMEQPKGRCPDALGWALAAAPALGCTEEEMRAALSEPPPGPPLVADVQALLAPTGSWEGAATELLEQLPPDPSYLSARGLSQQLHNCREALTENRIQVKQHRTTRIRTIHLCKLPDDASSAPTPKTSAPASPPPCSWEKSMHQNGQPDPRVQAIPQQLDAETPRPDAAKSFQFCFSAFRSPCLRASASKQNVRPPPNKR